MVTIPKPLLGKIWFGWDCIVHEILIFARLRDTHLT